MSSLAHISHFARPRAKSSVITAYIACPALLVMSGYGFWEFCQLPGDTRPVQLAEIYYLMCLVVVPIVLCLFLSVVAAQRLEYNRLSGGYQTRLDHLQKRLATQEDLLHLMTDHDPEAIAIFDEHNRFWFVNKSAAQFMELDVKDMIGRGLTKVLGTNYERIRTIESRLNDVRQSGVAIETLDQRPEKDGKVRFMQSRYEKIDAFGEFPGGVMVRSENVTSLLVERERRETMLRQVIATLVAVVDRRDPYAAGHSARVGQLSRAVAEELVLSEQEIETADIAGSLMNFGKVLVPREILTKTTALTADELQMVRDSILTSSDILSIINFSGAVVPTLREVLERFDGTGAPRGLKGDQILITARIVSVANAFIALVSPRAHRASYDAGEAVKRIMADADTQFDRRVVAALANFVENRATKHDWLNGKVKTGT